jgi:hypothetical protein
MKEALMAYCLLNIAGRIYTLGWTVQRDAAKLADVLLVLFFAMAIKWLWRLS